MAFLNKDAAFQYVNNYQKENYDRITILVKKGEKKRYKETADARKMSMTEFIVNCIEKEIGEA